jgi:nucleoside-diphosphate-sugar epimerase
MAPALGTSDYEQSKFQAEQWALARARGDQATRVTVVQPACVYGPRGATFTELPARLLRDGAFAWIEDGRGMTNYVYVRNLADAMIRAAGHRDARGERFIISDGFTTWRQFFTELFGESADELQSWTAAEIEAMAKSEQPTLRDLGRAVVRDPEVRRILRENAHLRRLTSGVARVFPHRYRRLQSGGRASQPRSGDRPALRRVPPVYLPLLFGPTSTRLSAAKASRVLGWAPAIDLRRGQSQAREWLSEVGLFDREGVPA